MRAWATGRQPVERPVGFEPRWSDRPPGKVPLRALVVDAVEIEHDRGHPRRGEVVSQEGGGLGVGVVLQEEEHRPVHDGVASIGEGEVDAPPPSAAHQARTPSAVPTRTQIGNWSSTK